ncbi:MAG: GNAT family N-acetyltransferase, partial [Pseudomonadota bacterium]
MTAQWTQTDIQAPLPAGAPGIAEQHPFHAIALKSKGARVLRLQYDHRGSALVVLKRWPCFGDFAVLARGPVWMPGTEPALQHAARTDLLHTLAGRFTGVMATSQPGTRDPGWLGLTTPGTYARLDIAQPPDVLRAALKGKWRNRLVKAEAAPIQVVERPLPDHRHWLFAMETEQRRTRRYAGEPLRQIRAWRRANGPASTRVFEAKIGKTRLAGLVFLLHPPWASYAIGWTSPAGRAVSAHHLLFWRAMLSLRQENVDAIDLDLIDTETLSGLARFKLGTGATATPLGAPILRAPGTRLIKALENGRKSSPPFS